MSSFIEKVHFDNILRDISAFTMGQMCLFPRDQQMVKVQERPLSIEDIARVFHTKFKFVHKGLKMGKERDN